MNNPTVKCRICWEDIFSFCVPMNTKWANESTKNIKDVLIFCVPPLLIEEESCICKVCLDQLKSTYSFIEKCLKSENRFKTENELEETDESNKKTSNNEQKTVLSDLDDSLRNSEMQMILHTPDITENHLSNENQEDTIESENKLKHDEEIEIVWHSPKTREKDQNEDTGSEIENDKTVCADFQNSNANVSDASDKEFEISLNLNETTSRRKDRDRIEEISKSIKENIDYSQDSIFLFTVNSNLPPKYHETLSQNGINICTMPSKRPNVKKRVIFLGKCLSTEEAFTYNCDECSAKFCSEKILKNHTKSHKRDYKCEKCHKGYLKEQEFVSHLAKFKGLPSCMLKCQRCKREFKTREGFNNHEKSVKDAPSCNYKQCTVCLEKFTREDFITHSKLVHPVHKCEICAKLYASYSLLSNHKKWVHSAGTIMCEECGKVMKTTSQLISHVEAVHSKGNSFACDKCPKRFVSKDGLKRHQFRHGQQKKTKYMQCELCGRKFTGHFGLRNHKRDYHEGEKKFTCPICNEGFFRKDYMNRHLNNHNNQHPCKICKMSFRNLRGLDVHLSAGHDENGLSKMVIKNADGTTVRKKNCTKYPDIKRVCKICNKVIANLYSLRNHYMVHLKLKIYRCEKCGLKLQSYNSLKRHQKLHDDPNYKFSCNICFIRHTSEVDLQRHMQKSHKTQKYKCNLCPAKFGRPALLDNHQLAVHSEILNKRKELYELLKQERGFGASDKGKSYGPKNNRGKLEHDLDKIISLL